MHDPHGLLKSHRLRPDRQRSKIRFMATKSDKRRVKRVSATEASRSFSRLLDEIEGGHRFLVYRRGRNVCVMASPSGHGRRASECLAILRVRSRSLLLDDEFGADLLDVLAGEPVEERPSWES
jgi:antitoxin (DNA-binding transcriptional repressor) of toxin-antitoxin stability system